MNEKQITELIERMRELGHIYLIKAQKTLSENNEKLNKPEKSKFRSLWRIGLRFVKNI